MMAVSFTFDDTPVFPGFADGTTWNGFDNVWVTLATAHEIDRWFAATCALEGLAYEDESIADMEPDSRGLICLAYGYATQNCRRTRACPKPKR